jgi:uncharacterized SAM-binding protein YcdF (DUF218 family)
LPDRRAGPIHLLGALGLGLFLMAAFTPLAPALGRATGVRPRIEPAEAVVVLGHGLRSDGTLTDASLRAALAGVELYRQALAPLLVLAGAQRAGQVSEAQVRAALAHGLGVPRAAIVLEETGKTTREEAERLRPRLSALGVPRILLITDSQHMRRAQAIFERLGFVVLPAPTDDPGAGVADPHGRLLLSWRLAREFAAHAYYRLAGHL